MISRQVQVSRELAQVDISAAPVKKVTSWSGVREANALPQPPAFPVARAALRTDQTVRFPVSAEPALVGACSLPISWQ